MAVERISDYKSAPLQLPLTNRNLPTEMSYLKNPFELLVRFNITTHNQIMIHR